jgi:hypothetical protein
MDPKREALEQRIAEDFETIKPWLPESVSDILDIGCGGLPLIDIWLARHYGGNINIHLMDGEERIPPVKKEQVSYREKTKAWKSRHDAVAVVRAEMPECNVYGHEPNPKLKIPCDLIISRRAWGHHFPISTYIELADSSLRPAGRIITDIRTGRGRDAIGFKTFNEYGFRPISGNIEMRSSKCGRWVFSR